MFTFIKVLWSHMKGGRRYYSLAVFLSVITIAVSVVPSMMVGFVIDKAIIADNPDRGLLIPVMLGVMAIVIVRVSLRYVMALLYEYSSQKMLMNLRETLYDVLQKLDSTFFSENSTGDLMTKLISDTEVTRHFFAWVVVNSVECVVLFIMTFIMLLTINVYLTLILLAVAPFIIFFNFMLLKKIRPFHIANREMFSTMNSTAQENINANKTVKAFAREEYEKEKMHSANSNMRSATLRSVMEWLKHNVPQSFFSNLLPLISLVAGSLFYINIESFSIGNLSVFIGLTVNLTNIANLTGPIFNEIQRFSASCEKLMTLYYARPVIDNTFEPIDITEFKTSIEFKNVYLSIDGKSILEDISLQINKGEFIGIMGPTGSGKTILLSMLQRFYDPTEGEILIDGINIKEYSLESLRRIFSFSYQDVFLHSNTVEGNIAFSDPDMESEITHKYAKSAHAHAFIKKMSEGYETVIGERGVGLSGGQRQRISLARALSTQAPILILDDTTSAVDFETEKKIQQSLTQLEEQTKILIAQRAAAVHDCDNIIIITNGKISQQGKFNELLSNEYFGMINKIQNDMV